MINDVNFSTEHLKCVHNIVRRRYPGRFEAIWRDAWTHTAKTGYEGGIPKVNFEWKGEAHNAYDARAKLWEAWLEEQDSKGN